MTYINKLYEINIALNNNKTNILKNKLIKNS